LLFTFLQLIVVGSFFHLDLSHANYLTATFIMLVGSVSSSVLGLAHLYCHFSTRSEVHRCLILCVQFSC
jgi:biotin transporter BioY